MLELGFKVRSGVFPLGSLLLATNTYLKMSGGFGNNQSVLYASRKL